MSFWAERRASLTEIALTDSMMGFLKGEDDTSVPEKQGNILCFIGFWREGCCKVRYSFN